MATFYLILNHIYHLAYHIVTTGTIINVKMQSNITYILSPVCNWLGDS